MCICPGNAAWLHTHDLYHTVLHLSFSYRAVWTWEYQCILMVGLTLLLPGDFCFKSYKWASLCNSITHQVIELESCSNPQKMRQVLLFALKKFGSFRFQFFCEWLHKWDRFSHFWPISLCHGLQTLKRIFWLKFWVETRFKSDRFEFLIGFLVLLVWKSRPKNKSFLPKIWVNPKPKLTKFFQSKPEKLPPLEGLNSFLSESPAE